MIPRRIKCARCGEETFATGPSQKYCRLCAYQIRLEKNAARHKAKKKTVEHTKHIKCAICGADVVVSSKAARAKFCPECSEKAYGESRKRSRAREAARRDQPNRLGAKIGVEITTYCSLCGAEFSYYYTGSYRARCDECRKRKKGAPRKGKRPRVSQIEAINQAARERGMSYGPYQAMLAMQRARKKGAR